jgi:hypothetical protein
MRGQQRAARGQAVPRRPQDDLNAGGSISAERGGGRAGAAAPSGALEDGQPHFAGGALRAEIAALRGKVDSALDAIRRQGAGGEEHVRRAMEAARQRPAEDATDADGWRLTEVEARLRSVLGSDLWRGAGDGAEGGVGAGGLAAAVGAPDGWLAGLQRAAAAGEAVGAEALVGLAVLALRLPPGTFVELAPGGDEGAAGPVAARSPRPLLRARLGWRGVLLGPSAPREPTALRSAALRARCGGPGGSRHTMCREAVTDRTLPRLLAAAGVRHGRTGDVFGAYFGTTDVYLLRAALQARPLLPPPPPPHVPPHPSPRAGRAAPQRRHWPARVALRSEPSPPRARHRTGSRPR